MRLGAGLLLLLLWWWLLLLLDEIPRGDELAEARGQRDLLAAVATTRARRSASQLGERGLRQERRQGAAACLHIAGLEGGDEAAASRDLLLTLTMSLLLAFGTQGVGPCFGGSAPAFADAAGELGIDAASVLMLAERLPAHEGTPGDLSGAGSLALRAPAGEG